MDSPPSGRTPKKQAPLGSLKHLEQLLGLRRDQVLSRDAAFISLDLEAAMDRKTLRISGDKPVVKQLGFAYLNTRDIQNPIRFKRHEDVDLDSGF
ncbi:putative qde-2-interacting protein [Trichoderma arundinaceum]|uniref:Putative qde-2-interacting protein n=1 Tax=Trichoderma arundinaceum TaxID=490622 RepID=A0A395NRX6_TRIAR|nr:putative qde-2-interacting protein [Trichoderma arundinaceum]